MNEEFHLKLIINEIEDRITSLTRITLTQVTRFWDNQNRTTNNSNPSQNNYGIRHNYNYNGNNFQKANAQSSFNNKRPKTYDDRYPRENKFRENEQVAKQFYDQENRQLNINPRGRPYNTGIFRSNNSRDPKHQILNRIKYSLKLLTGLRKKSITVMLSLISFL